ncbi:hypothetical protein GR160_03080 [Flavobacterium sp. Sd200]|uniref:hypothetical protein n=1 Tax=Flavobacterium sp. Sd200 TaxID=2692211 RepID=UPI0013703732|nr:hypothetical protein [Flavobacterium sp. Sd200]MXN90198.1 hypothetical protein [Flavobacterium sp. Sd200]
MKKFLFISLLAMIASISMKAQSAGWESWQKTSCYSKISFRLKDEGMRGEQHVWKVQFKNDYEQLISFNYHVTDKMGQYNTTTHRKTIMGGRISDELEVFTKEQDLFLLVDKVSLSPYPKDFVECDSN